MKPVGFWWTTHPKRRYYDYLTFEPGHTNPNAYNLWQGYGCKSVPGENHQPFLKHVLNNVCANNSTHYDYLTGWMARAIQYPNRPGETAIVLRGRSGVGKSFFAKQLGSIWGRHFLQVSDAKHLVGAFNAHLRDCVLLFGDEAFFAGDRKHESVLKTLITEERMIIEHKGVDAEVCPNYIHLILASNSSWVIPTGPTERRFMVLDVSNQRQQDNAYFSAIDKAMDNGGRENLLYHLLNYDLKGFDVRKVPLTDALREQKMHSLDPMGQWWLGRLMDGALCGLHENWSNEVLCQDLVDDYIKVCAQFNVQRRGSEVKLGLFLNNVCPMDYPVRLRQSAGAVRRYFYRFPPLQTCRDKWDEIQGSPENWPKIEESNLVEPTGLDV